MRLVLASASPRRREILENAGIDFTVRPANVDESTRADESAGDYVRRLAESKARAAWQPGETTLGADTTVVVDSRILGKPVDESEGVEMLSLLAGRSHEVITGYCLFDGESATAGAETTRVLFSPMTRDEIVAYVRSGEPFDKAGGYGIQGLASKFIQGVEGCYFNVVGLPVARVYALLKL